MEQNTSTAESNHNNQPEKANDVATRSYDCTFCKRGFTNAQALGGHMNIHRKDKAKAKPKQKTREDPFSSSFFPQKAAASYDQVCIHLPNPGLQTGNYEYCFFPVWRPADMQDRINGNFSMRIGTVEEDEEVEEEVDLELRLGRSL